MILETALLFSIIFYVATAVQEKNDPIANGGDKTWSNAE